MNSISGWARGPRKCKRTLTVTDTEQYNIGHWFFPRQPFLGNMDRMRALQNTEGTRRKNVPDKVKLGQLVRDKLGLKDNQH
jgi:hypothetical protein